MYPRSQRQAARRGTQRRDPGFVDWRTAAREPDLGQKYRVGDVVWVKVRALGQEHWTKALAEALITVRFMGFGSTATRERLEQDVRNMGYVPEAEVDVDLRVD